ncbi:MAG: putative xylanase/chitin deacetylase [Frankiales bacterium]|nr:putative xylanase/chitin deacetylase [Frankiales bacterium]
MTGRDATRPADPIRWPPGMRAAAVLGFDMDAEAVVLTVDSANAGRLSVMSHQAYGPVTGMPRILKMLERRNLRATFFCPGYTAERYPDLVRRVRDGGHELAHHGYLHEAVQGMDEQQEGSLLDRGLEALERISGQRPVGYRAPMWETTYATARLLLDRGFLYDSSLMDCDVPYELAESPDDDARSIVEIPVSWSLDDWEQYAYLPDVFGSGLIEDPAKSLSMWKGELTESHAEGACFTLTSHPFLTGRLGRLRALDDLIGVMADWSDLWIATAAEVAAHTRSLGLSPRVFPQPEV